MYQLLKYYAVRFNGHWIVQTEQTVTLFIFSRPINLKSDLFEEQSKDFRKWDRSWITKNQTIFFLSVNKL